MDILNKAMKENEKSFFIASFDGYLTFKPEPT